MSQSIIYRVRLQLSNGKVAEKTTTESSVVADYAFCDLLHRYVGEPVAATMTKRDGDSQPVNMMYLGLADTKSYQCQRCQYSGAFIDDGTTCPNCKLEQ